MVYRKLSTFKEGEDVQGGGVAGGAGDRITMTLDPMMPGSSHSRPYDSDGMPLEARVVIKDGKLLKYCADTRFASYLNIEPTGGIGNVHIAGGTASDEDLRREPYLEIVSLSDFQTNPVTGDFGSEIRLAFYFDGKTVAPVTGGSISGNVAAVQGGMRMSAQERQYDRYKGPATICIRGASISGTGK